MRMRAVDRTFAADLPLSDTRGIQNELLVQFSRACAAVQGLAPALDSAHALRPETSEDRQGQPDTAVSNEFCISELYDEPFCFISQVSISFVSNHLETQRRVDRVQ